MDEEMDEGAVEVFNAVEIDLDYEYDAARFFDFTRAESDAEVWAAESWFDSAPDYPPSPFVANLFLREDLCSENANTSPKSKYDDSMILVDSDTDVAEDSECANQDVINEAPGGMSHTRLENIMKPPPSQSQVLLAGYCKGLSFYNHFADDIKKTKTKSFVKPLTQRSSTLMKPTASQLAKQNQHHQVCDSRLQKASLKNQSSTSTHFGVETQAAKRQRLEGGQLCKVGDVKQQTNFMHKVPKKDGTVNGMFPHSKLRLTIPREPDLETAHRAHRTRSTNVKEVESTANTVYRFKARPLNRKILEAPKLQIPKRSTPQLPEFQVFHLKTMERAMQHSSAVTSSSLCQTDQVSKKVENDSKYDKRSDAVATPNLVENLGIYSFKARPLDKILASRGDIGVLRNNKRDTTVPKAFDFQTGKRNQLNPPVELFNKLSLASELQPKSSMHSEFAHHTCIPSKGSKENRWASSIQDNLNKVKNCAKEHHEVLSLKHLHAAGDGGIGRSGPQTGLTRIFRF